MKVSILLKESEEFMQEELNRSKLDVRITAEFWRQAFAIHGSITPHVLPNVLLCGMFGAVVSLGATIVEQKTGVRVALSVGPHEIVGGALGVILVLRTNAGYERWWEARKLWGGIVNQCRNLCISALAYGPKDPEWQEQFVRCVALFPHSARLSLRDERAPSLVASIVGPTLAAKLNRAEHLPMSVALEISRLLSQAVRNGGMHPMAFQQAENQRALLIDHVGACERILKTPLAMAYCIKIRRFIAMFVLSLPFALIDSLQHNPLLVSLMSMLVAYPLFSLDQLGIELQNPFSLRNLSHLPLSTISNNIEKNVLQLLREAQSDEASDFNMLDRALCEGLPISSLIAGEEPQHAADDSDELHVLSDPVPAS